MGGAGLYLLLPQPGKSRALPGVALSVLALAGLLSVLAVKVIAPSDTSAYFCLFSAIAIFGASRVITHRKPVYSALYFVLVVISVAALLVLQRAEFLAVALIIVYAGAIIVTYLFVIMLAQQSHETVYDTRAREPFFAVLVGFVLMAAITGKAVEPATTSEAKIVTAQFAQQNLAGAIEGLPEGNTADVAAALLTKYIVVLEIAGVLLLVSMVGAVALSRKKIPVEGHGLPTRPLGQIGKEVEPF